MEIFRVKLTKTSLFKINMNKNLHNIFEGEQSLLNFLDPSQAVPSPMVEIPSSMNPYREQGVRIFAKLMNALPLGNIKSLPAYNMLAELDSEKRSKIETIIENSSGNTVFSLAVIARVFGIKHTKAIVSHEVSRGKLNILRFLGVETIVNREPICPDPSDPESGIYKSKILAKQKGWFNPGQYDNNANPEAHYKWTGPQIWSQCNGRVDIVSVALGTTGSITGIGKFLKEKNKHITIVGVVRKPNNPVPGARTHNLLKEVSFPWSDVLGAEESVGTKEAYRASLKLCRSGLFVGPSSGFVFAGLLQYLSKQDLSSKKEKVAVFVCPDGPFPYLDEYFEVLDKKDFPEVENAALLNADNKNIPLSSYLSDDEIEIAPLVLMQSLSQAQEEWTVVDLRTATEFEDHHIPGAINVPFERVREWTRSLSASDNLSKVVFVCRYGNRSKEASRIAREFGVPGFSLRGGDAEWSSLNLPRERPEKCLLRHV